MDQSRWLLELEDIEKDTSRIIERLRVSDRDSQSTKSEFEPGDILYGKLRPYLNKVVVADEPGYSTTEIVAIRPLLRLCPEYCALAFRRPDFVATVADALRRHAIPASLLTLELTESMVMGDVERAARQLAELKALGLSLAIDDFGTGYSSLAYLKRFPLDKLKVDQSFVREINEGPEDRAIVAAIVGLGHNLGVTLVAEGVETRAMAETLRELGCDALQGWLFGRAEPAAEFAARLG